MGTGHLSAFVGAAVARLGAALAVIVLVFLAFATASLADFGAHLANVLRELGVATHQGGCRPADLGTVFVEPNAFRHFVYIGFPEASLAAMFTGSGAFDAGFDTGLVFVMVHNGAP